MLRKSEMVQTLSTAEYEDRSVSILSHYRYEEDEIRVNEIISGFYTLVQFHEPITSLNDTQCSDNIHSMPSLDNLHTQMSN